MEAALHKMDSQVVLVVDDDPGAADVASHILHRAGYEVVLAGDGNSALETAKITHPCAIFLDLVLPNLDGYQVCRQLREEPLTQAIPIIIVSAQRSRDSVLRSLEAGADDFLIKPIDSQVMLHKLNTLKRDGQLVQALPSGDVQIDPKTGQELTADNRRQFIRFDLEAEAIVHLELQILDISEGGMGFLADIPFLPGNTINLKVPALEEVIGTAEIKIMIRYCRMPKTRSRYRVGGEFEGISEANRKKIRQFVYRRQLARVRVQE